MLVLEWERTPAKVVGENQTAKTKRRLQGKKKSVSLSPRSVIQTPEKKGHK